MRSRLPLDEENATRRVEPVARLRSAELYPQKMKSCLHHRVLAHFPAVLAQTGGVALVSAVSVACAPMFDSPLQLLSVALFVLAIAAAYASVRSLPCCFSVGCFIRLSPGWLARRSPLANGS
jgi:hypothetical protein